ncbi:iron-sulfur cluster-binding protein [Apiospora arundinis]|uniref:Iron-sulfur cluster-binding protein n=1 Tax=Apiospora arundinis TaxID=335852 RepID=A0ABR2HQR2_9PEZI
MKLNRRTLAFTPTVTLHPFHYFTIPHLTVPKAISRPPAIMSTNSILLTGGVHLVTIAFLALVCAALAWLLLLGNRMLDEWLVLALKRGTGRMGLNAAEEGTSSIAISTERIPYDLEKRAILHRRWMMVGHESQFVKPGDYRTYTIADIPFFVIKGKDEDKDGDTTLRAFHNVCRHRAYTVVRKPRGSSLRLACKYHGWQYDSAGQLVKAPEFADKPGFDFDANGLFRIHLRIDSGRFVFINLATELADAFPWSDISSPSLRTLDFGQGVAEWEIELRVSWRVATLLPWFLDGTRIMHHPWPKKALTYLWPANRLLHLQYVDDASFICDLGAGDFLLISAQPLTAYKSIAKCTYLPSPHAIAAHSSPITMTPKHPSATDSSTIAPDNLTTYSIQVEKRVRDELTLAVTALRRHRMATTDLGFRQSVVRERLDKFSRHVHQHRRAETLAGRKINPALRRRGSNSSTTTTTPRSSTTYTGEGSRTMPITGAAVNGGGGGNDSSNYPIDGGGACHLAASVPNRRSNRRQQQVSNFNAADELDADLEAEAICNVLDGLGDGATTSGFSCPLLSEQSTELEW